MTPKLRNLLTAIGVVIAGGITAVVYLPNPGTTQADLLDAGIGSCVQGEALCEVLYLDGGTYDRLRVRGAACQETDGGWALIPDVDALDGAELVMTHDGAACERATGANKLKTNERRLKEPHKCACVPALPDGGPVATTCRLTADAGQPLRVHMRPGEWTGTCIPKPCGELAGVSSWPAACGPESMPP